MHLSPALARRAPDIPTLEKRWRLVLADLSEHFELRKARERGHILEGLAVALSNVDEIITLIKAAPTPADAKRGEEDEWPIARPFPSIVSSSTMSWA